ncbi:MAG: DUF4331 domain-containing protein [Acidobacteriota bacterium]
MSSDRPNSPSGAPHAVNLLVLLLLAVAFVTADGATASSHREAPSILSTPQVDGTDFYMFRSYEPGRDGFVTLIANYNPLQVPYGGPNYFPLDGDAFYDIHISNNGDAVEDITFRFRLLRQSPFVALQVGEAGATETVPVPLLNVGPIGSGFGVGAANERRSFTLRVVRGDMTSPQSVAFASRADDPNRRRFPLPLDNAGAKSFPDYAAYAARHVYDIAIPGCGDGRVFVGQRAEGFAVNLGEVFDLVNTNPLGPVDGETSDTAGLNITSLALEVPTACLTDSSDVIAGWTAARLPRTARRMESPDYLQATVDDGDFVQVSRLANPLVNEVAIGLPDKDRFNGSHPRGDAQFLRYVTHPTLPELLEVLFGVRAPDLFPREDLVQVFLTGVPGLNADGSVGEMMRLNTAIPAVPAVDQDPFGVLGGDLAGYPNGRRPGDDTVDISLRAVMGALLDPSVAPDGQLPYTDGAFLDASAFDAAFPYLRTPFPGSPDATP